MGRQIRDSMIQTSLWKIYKADVVQTILQFRVTKPCFIAFPFEAKADPNVSGWLHALGQPFRPRCLKSLLSNFAELPLVFNNSGSRL